MTETEEMVETRARNTKYPMVLRARLDHLG
jgi:hypothetical protein